MVLPDYLADRLLFLRAAEVRADLPDHVAVARHDRDEAGLPAADDHIVGREARVARIEPVVRPHVRGRVYVQRIECAARAGCPGANRRARARIQPERVNVIADLPIPADAPVRIHLDEAIVFQRNRRNCLVAGLDVRQQQRNPARGPWRVRRLSNSRRGSRLAASHGARARSIPYLLRAG